MSIKKLCSRFSVVLANNNRICSQAEHKNRRPSHILLASYYRHTRYCMPPSKLAILAGERTCIPEFKVCRPIELYCFAPSPYLEHPCIAHEIEDLARNFDHVRFASILRTLLTSAQLDRTTQFMSISFQKWNSMPRSLNLRCFQDVLPKHSCPASLSQIHKAAPGKARQPEAAGHAVLMQPPPTRFLQTPSLSPFFIWTAFLSCTHGILIADC